MKYILTSILGFFILFQAACDNGNQLVNELFFSFDQGKVWRYDYTSDFPSGGKDVNYTGISTWTTKSCVSGGENIQTCSIEEVFVGNRTAKQNGVVIENGAYTQTKQHIFKIDNGTFTVTLEGREYGPINLKPKNETEDTITFGSVNSYTGQFIFKKNVGIQEWRIDYSLLGQYYKVTQVLIP